MDTQIREPLMGMQRWQHVLTRSALALAALLAVAAVGLRDLEAGAFTVGTLVALALLRWRGGGLGKLALTLLGINVAFWMGTGAVSNLSHGEGFWETALPASLTIAAIVTVLAGAGALLRRGDRAATAVQTIGVVALVGVVALSAIGVGTAVRPESGDTTLVTENVKFSDTTLDARAGRVGVFVTNKDLFWHTFTISELGVNLNVPVGGDRRIEFDASPGTYEFVCAIPGHTQAGMKGTLTVSR